MPQRRASSTMRALAIDSTIAAGGALAVAVGTIVGLAANNPALAGISLSIGAGGLIGWLLAGSAALNKGSGR
jgi:hypothetical protein